MLSRRLVEIPTDLPIPFDPEKLRRSEPDFATLKEIFVRARVPLARRGDPGRSRRPPPEIRLDATRVGELFLRATGRPPRRRPAEPRRAALLAAVGRYGDADRGGDAARAVERWAALDRPAARSSRWPTRSRSTRCSPAPGAPIAGDVFDVCLAQYVLSTGSRQRRDRAHGIPSPGHEAARGQGGRVSACALPEGYEIANADRWLAERASAAAAARRAAARRARRPPAARSASIARSNGR